MKFYRRALLLLPFFFSAHLYANQLEYNGECASKAHIYDFEPGQTHECSKNAI